MILTRCVMHLLEFAGKNTSFRTKIITDLRNLKQERIYES